MFSNTPPLPQGTSAFHVWARRVQQALLQLRPVESPGIRVERPSRGMRLKPVVMPGSPPAPAGGGATRYRVKDVEGDYLVCRTFDGTVEGSTDVLVAKPPELRHSLVAQTIENVAVSYVYSTRANNLDGKRVASATGFESQTEIVLPVFIVANTSDGEIWADKPEGGTGVEVDDVELEWMDTNRAGRAWCEIP